MTYAFTHMGNFLHLSLEARIWAFWIGFGPRDWDLGLGTRIWASKLGEEGLRTEEEKEKIPHMCESIGHQPLLSRCPKKYDQATRQFYTWVLL